MNVNSLGILVSKPDNVLYIMRGVSGGGKSTKAKSLVGDGHIHSTDALIEATGDYGGFFAEMIKVGNFANLSRMHSKNLTNAKKSMNDGVTPVVIDNTHLKANEAKGYVKHALEVGYADENIRIVDIGTGGLTAEQLAARNTHGVPLKKIEEMVKTHKTVGELTLKKILESKDMYPQSDVLFTAIVLEERFRGQLLATFSASIPEGWNKSAHHMTIVLGEMKDKEDLGKSVALQVEALGVSDMAIAVKVSGYRSKNAVPHITLAVNPNGGKPVMSNDIVNWEPTERITVVGIISEIKKTLS